MKKPKHLLLAIVAVAMSLALSFSVACSGSCSSSCGGAKLSSIELDTEDVKTEYYTGETLSTEGLKITAVYSDKKTEELTLETEGVRVDTTEYQRYTVGTYEIKVSYTAGEVTCNASYNVNVSEVTLSVDTSNVKVLYIVGEDEFTSDNLVVKRTVTTTEGSTSTTLTSSEYNLDKGGFSHTKVGDYVITVSATYNYLTINASYTARVIEPRQGLEVTLKTDYQSKSTITLQGTEADVAVADLSQAGDWIQVRQPDKYGVVADNAPILDASKYTVEVYEGQNKIQNADLATLGGGAYTVWVTMNGEDNNGEPFVYYGFQIVYVIDNVKSIELDDSCSTTMVRNLENTMYKSWQFNVLYDSGKTVKINSDASGLDLPAINTNQEAAGEDKNANVTGTVVASYSEKNAKREEKNVKSEEITYTLTGKVVDTSVAHFSMGDLATGDITDSNTTLTSGGLTFTFVATSSSKLVVDASSKKITLPSGITVDDKTEVTVANRLKSGGKSSDTARYLSFTTNKNFTIYGYALSGSSSDATRKLTLSASESTVKIGDVDSVKSFNEGVDVSDTPSARAQKVTDVTKETTFNFGFSASINLYYICIVFN